MKRVVKDDGKFVMTGKERDFFVSACLSIIRTQLLTLKRLDALSYEKAKQFNEFIDTYFYLGDISDEDLFKGELKGDKNG